METVSRQALTLAQRRFAEREHAVVGLRAPDRDGVFLYRDDPWASYRWLVDSAGQALETACFLKPHTY